MNAKSNRQCPDLRQAAGGEKVIAPPTIGPLQDFPTLWQMAFDATDDMISVLDLRHRIIAVNKAMAQALGCAPEQAVGRHCFDLLHKDDKPPMACPHTALLEDGRAHRSEIYDAKLDVWLQVDVTPLYDSNQELAGSIHIARDITQQKRSEQAYRESEERYRHLSEATMEGVLLSQESTIIAANQVLADMMGYAVKEMIGMNMFKFVAPGHRHRLVQMLRQRRAEAHAFDCIRKDGTLFSIEARSRVISYKGGMVYQTAIRDLTDQIRIERQRSQHERMRGVLEMAGAICHEINQPLMALQGFMTIMSGSLQLQEDAEMHLRRMAEQVGRLKTLTRKIMRITKYATKEYPGGEKIIDIDQSSPEEVE
jgi:PAS domain S-box-containing protein